MSAKSAFTPFGSDASSALTSLNRPGGGGGGGGGGPPAVGGFGATKKTDKQQNVNSGKKVDFLISSVLS